MAVWVVKIFLGGMQNYIDFTLEINILQEFFVNLKVRFLHFLTSWNTVFLQNTIISFECYVDFWPKIYIILYPSLENLTTHIAIATMPVRNNYADAKNEEAAIAIFFKTPSSILSKVPSLVSCQFFSQTSLL